MEKAVRKNRIDGSKLLSMVLVILILILGLVKAVELGFHFATGNKKVTRQISIAESIEIMNKMDKEYKVSGMTYYSPNYMTGFKQLDIPLSRDEQEFLYILGKDYGLSYPLLLGLIDYESSFDEDSISSTNDYGLMQINIINHEWLKKSLGFEDMLNPYNNIRSGTFILSQLCNKYSSEAEVLMAYNMGESGAKKLWNNGIYHSNYSNKVLENKAKYESLLQ